ncbi:hypothetical protein FJZ18_01810 [Candidatus Pacearchaeota archaeon]|nr:hypothetical protein [Candidatus Pacearchaeota archaeon]
MNIIGFNFTKITGEKSKKFKTPFTIDTNIEFTSIEKEKLEILKEVEPITASFKFSLNYIEINENEKNKKGQKQGEISFEGTLVLSANKEEAKDLLKSWKKNEIPDHLRQPLFNTLLRRCTLRAIPLEEELGLPLHINIPLLEFKK